MKPVLSFLAGLFAAALLQVAATRWLWWFPAAVDPFLVLVVFVARRGSRLAGTAAGCLAGLVSDALAGGLFGLRGFADTIVGYVAAVTVHRFAADRAVRILWLFSLAAVVQQLVLMALTSIFLPATPPPGFVWILARVASTGLLGMLLHRAAGRVERWSRHRHRRRGARIRFGP